MVSNHIISEQRAEKIAGKKKEKRRIVRQFSEDIEYDLAKYNSFEVQIDQKDKLVNKSFTDSENSEDGAKQMLNPHFVE